MRLRVVLLGLVGVLMLGLPGVALAGEGEGCPNEALRTELGLAMLKKPNGSRAISRCSWQRSARMTPMIGEGKTIARWW
jgi:hypothetical protein